MYHYPPVILCPNLWLDADKALSLGLSLEGLKCSLGYVNVFRDKTGPDNHAVGRQEFFSFFDTSNYTSFDDYLMAISPDITVEPSIEIYENTSYSSAICSRCEIFQLPKVATRSGVCYNFQMQPEIGRRRLSTVYRLIRLRLEDRSRGLISTSLWNLYIGAEQDISVLLPHGWL